MNFIIQVDYLHKHQLEQLRELGVKTEVVAVHELHTTHRVKIASLEQLIKIVDGLDCAFTITPDTYWQLEGKMAFIKERGWE